MRTPVALQACASSASPPTGSCSRSATARTSAAGSPRTAPTPRSSCSRATTASSASGRWRRSARSTRPRSRRDARRRRRARAAAAGRSTRASRGACGVRSIDAMLGQPYVKSALDMAVHDLAAKAAGVPLCSYLGGRYGTSVDLYRSVSQDAPEAMARSAAAYVAAGYRRIQVKVGGDPAQDVERVHAVRAAVPRRRRALLRCQRRLDDRAGARVPARDARPRDHARAAVHVVRRLPRRARRSARIRSCWTSASTRCPALLAAHRDGVADGVTIKIARVGRRRPGGAAARRGRRSRPARHGRGHRRQRHRHRGDGAPLALDARGAAHPHGRLQRLGHGRQRDGHAARRGGQLRAPDGPGLGVEVRLEELGEPFGGWA